MLAAPFFDGDDDGGFDAGASNDLGALLLDAVEDLGELGGGLLEGPGMHVGVLGRCLI